MIKITIGIYKIINKETGQKYIGQSINIEKRFKEHINGTNCPSSYIDNAIRKYGKANFNFEIVEKFNKDTLFLNDVLNNKEQYYIILYNTFKNEFHYNLTPGGDFNPMKVPEIVQRRSGENHPMYKNKHSEKTRKKMSEAKKGKYTGKNHPFYGKQHSEETKKKMSESSIKKYARIIKAGKKNNKQRYAIRYQGQNIKHSISIDKLKKWFSKNYPNKELKINFN